MSKYVHYGCGIYAPVEWENYDVSPTLRIQKIPLIGTLLKNKLNAQFPSNIKFGDIIKGLPVPQESCSGVYCSHTLEHLALNDFRKALKNTFKILKPKGIFRCVVPDLEWAARNYVNTVDASDGEGSFVFLRETLLGVENRPRGVKELASLFFGNSHHLWMWDRHSLSQELSKAGFKDIRLCRFNDSEDEMFKLVENEGRFRNALAIQCIK